MERREGEVLREGGRERERERERERGREEESSLYSGFIDPQSQT
jgi:hypothetical protein